MGVIVKKLRVVGDKGERRAQVVFDTGTSASFARRDLVEKIATAVRLPSPKSYSLADGAGRLRVHQTAVL